MAKHPGDQYRDALATLDRQHASGAIDDTKRAEQRTKLLDEMERVDPNGAKLLKLDDALADGRITKDFHYQESEKLRAAQVSAAANDATFKKVGLGCLGVIAFLVVMFGVIPALSGDDGGGNDQSSDTRKYLAISACKNAVKKQLKSPASAKFSDEVAIATGTNAWAVSGTVDADNSYGASLRGSFACDVTTADQDTYTARVTKLE